MPEIKIPFRPAFKEVMLSGQKTCTSRTRRYGDIGDVFTAFGHQFKIVVVLKSALWYVANHLYGLEGCGTPGHFINIWNTIHPRRKYNGDDMVWLHHFRKVEFEPKEVP